MKSKQYYLVRGISLDKGADETVRFILLSAKPLKEPIAWGGPIVMNTQEELDLAFIIRNETINNNKIIRGGYNYVMEM